MATTTGTNVRFEKVIEKLMDGTIDIDNHTFGVLLLKSSATIDSVNDEFVTDVIGVAGADEVDSGGYARQNLSNVQWIGTGSGGQMKFDADNPVWTATGTSITSHYWVLYDNDAAFTDDTDKPVLAYGYLDQTPLDVVTAVGNTLTLNVNASGFFTVG